MKYKFIRGNKKRQFKKGFKKEIKRKGPSIEKRLKLMCEKEEGNERR